MCETELCQEKLNIILNLYIPQILPALDNYVVKGGRASDFYISQSTHQMLFGFTDWDLACDSEASQTIIKNTIISYLNEQGITNIETHTTTTPDKKHGIQLGIKCNEEICFFIDIFIYESTDDIFNNPLISNGIKYVNIDYLFDDLKQTNTDRTERLSEQLELLDITTIDPHRLTDNVNSYMDIIQQQIIRRATDKGIAETIKVQENPRYISDEKDDFIEEIKKRTSDNINSFISEELPKIRTDIQKLIRTNIRLRQISQIVNQQKAGRKRKTIKKRSNNKTFRKKYYTRRK